VGAALRRRDVELRLSPRGRTGPNSAQAPSAAQLRAVDDLVTHEEATFIGVLHALREHYDRVRPGYLRFFARLRGAYAVDPEVVMPASPDDTSFARLFELETIAVQPGAVDGLAYVHFYFSTEWEREHGIGVAVHGRRVLEVGYGSDLLQSSDYDVVGAGSGHGCRLELKAAAASVRASGHLLRHGRHRDNESRPNLQGPANMALGGPEMPSVSDVSEAEPTSTDRREGNVAPSAELHHRYLRVGVYDGMSNAMVADVTLPPASDVIVGSDARSTVPIPASLHIAQVEIITAGRSLAFAGVKRINVIADDNSDHVIGTPEELFAQGWSSPVELRWARLNITVRDKLSVFMKHLPLGVTEDEKGLVTTKSAG
jgi:hypothetical protein